MGGSMKFHKYARGVWEHEPTSSSLDTHGYKRLRPLAPKLSDKTDIVSAIAFDLKSFIRPHCGPRKLDDRKDSQQVEATAQLGGTRWNPTQEQIGKLEELYRDGMRTPNAQQIEQITSKLAKYGNIEGKNVFYWFQNHKARERQKQKRNNLSINCCPRSTSSSTHSSLTTTTNLDIRVEAGREEHSPYKRKCMSWIQESMDTDDGNNKSCRSRVGENKTLELFPLCPERRS